MKNAIFKSFGSYVPDKIVTNDSLSEIVETSDEWISSRTGIKQRHISTNQNTSDLCTEAARKILKNANISAKDIDVIIVATYTPDFQIPAVACLVQKNIGATKAFAFDISAACTGFVYATHIAEKMIKSGAYKNIIVIGGEVQSKILDWTDRNTCVLFGDGAGGALISEGEHDAFLAEDLHSDGTDALSLTARYFGLSNYLNSNTANNESDYFLKMNGKAIYDFVLKTIPNSINEVMQKGKVSQDEIKYIVLHQANFRIIEAVAKKMKIDLAKFYANISEYGNTSAASIPIAIDEMIDKKLITLGSNEKIIISGFGGGLTWGSMLISL